jgi:hypothetical protein
MRKNKLTLWELIDSEGAAVARCWALMAKLDVDYAKIERALADLVPGPA